MKIKDDDKTILSLVFALLSFIFLGYFEIFKEMPLLNGMRIFTIYLFSFGISLLSIQIITIKILIKKYKS